MGDEDLNQPEELPSEEEEQETDPTYIVPQGHGRFVFPYPRLINAADNFEKGNAQAESKIISNWLTTGLEIAATRMGWFLFHPNRNSRSCTGGITTTATLTANKMIDPTS